MITHADVVGRFRCDTYGKEYSSKKVKVYMTDIILNFCRVMMRTANLMDVPRSKQEHVNTN